MPDDTAGDNRGQVHFLCQTVTALFIGQEIGGQRQPTPGEHRVRIPRESCHRFHTKVATDSITKLPIIPRQSCHWFHGKAATPEPNATQVITHRYRESFSPYEGGSDATPEVIDASDPGSVTSQMGGWAQ